MKKLQRILSGLLVLCMILSLMPATVLATEIADSNDFHHQQATKTVSKTGAPVTRLAGDDRFQTAFAVADAMKAELGIEKFDAVIVASGTNFADALSGSYLGIVKNAPILLSCNEDFNPKYIEKYNNLLIDYIENNMRRDGTVYILGGAKAVAPVLDDALADYTVKRLAGNNRYETNICILKEAGIKEKDILVCNGESFSTSLSASATKLPILQVNSNYGLFDVQKEFLEKLDTNFHILGGTAAVSQKVEDQIKTYGETERIGGKDRFETSVLIAEKFFRNSDAVVLAYAWNFPDGLCGGPLAATLDAPLILTMEKYEAKAAEYVQGNTVSKAVVLGGEKLIPNTSVDLILANQSLEETVPVETVPEETAPEEAAPEVREETFLPDRSADFTFLVSCEQGEEYLRKNLILTGENGAITYSVTAEEEGLYRIAATEPYQQYQTYHVQGAEDMLFPEYNAKALEFSIIGPDRAEIEFNEDNLIFLKTLELAQYGTSGMYDLQWDEAAQRYYLTLFELKGIEPSMVGKVFGIGDYVNSADILADSTRELYFAKLEKISHNAEDDLLLELSVPQLSEVYDKLDIYFSAGTGGTQINGDPEQAFTDAVVTSEGFTEYLATAHMAAESYAESYGLVAEPVAAASKDNLKFELTKHDFRGTEDDSACVLELGGKITYTIPLKTKAGHASGSIVLTCNAEITSYISAGGEFKDDEYANLHLTNTTTTTLSFDMDFNLEYSYANEEHYLVHKNTQTIHTATCRIANKETNPANLRKLTVQELSELYNGDKETMRKHECKVCLAVTGLDGSAYVYNKNTGVLHCMNCLHVKDIKDCNLYTLYPDNTIGFETCKDCQPEKRQVRDFDKRMLNAIKGSDWEKQVTSFQEILGDSIGSPKPSVDKDPKLSWPINVFGVFNITIGVDPVFEFDMKASANFTLTASTKNEYGIRNEGKGFKTYHNEYQGDTEDTVEIHFTGEADAKFGINLSVSAHPVGALEKAAFIRINGQVGLYGHFSGIFSMEATAGGDTDTYCAARLEAGLYLKLDGYWKILWFDDPFVIIEETRLPLFKWGYDRMYYAFEEEEVEWIVEDPDALVTLLYLPEKMNAKYLDLKSMEYETGEIRPSLIGDSHFNITVDIQNEDGSPCDFLLYNEQLGTIVKKWGAPKYFTAIITVRVTPKVQIDSVNDFWNSQTKDKVYGCDLDPLVITLKAEEKKEQTEAEIYTEYLLNGGYKEIMGEAYSKATLSVSTCLFDIDNDGTKELLAGLQTELFEGWYQMFDALLDIENGSVVKRAQAYQGGGSGGGDYLAIAYDTQENKHVLVLDGYTRDGVSANSSYLHVFNEKYEKAVLLETHGYMLDTGMYEDTIAEIRKATSLYKENEGYLVCYTLNGKYISEKDYGQIKSRYAECSEECKATHSFYRGTHDVPIQGVGQESDGSDSTISIGDYIELGQYNDESILWRCVDIDENGPLMLSDRILSFKAFDANGEDEYYHTDGWGYIRKDQGSNCWSDSSLRQWLNSGERNVEYSHCPPVSGSVTANEYADEAGFLYGFSEKDMEVIKTVTQPIIVNSQEVGRQGYCDGGSEELPDISISDLAVITDYSVYFHQNVTDNIFLLNPWQVAAVEKNLPGYLEKAYPTASAVAKSGLDSIEGANTAYSFWTAIPNSTGASYQNIRTGPLLRSHACAYDGNIGVRPAFYLNTNADYAVVDVQQLCDAEWNGHFYKLFSNCSTWDEAKAYCESLGGHLATITSQEENDFVFGYVLSCGLESAYFGLSDAKEEGAWEWATGEHFSYTNWANGEPNNENGNEDYGMFYYQFTTGKWNDGNFGQGTFNDGNPIYFICEWDTEKEENTSTDWQKTYRDFIIQDKQNSQYSDFTDYVSYELIYLDDMVPELWINYGTYASGCRLLSYNDGKLMNEHMQASSLTYEEFSGLFCQEWGHMGVFSDTIYELENGVLATVAQGSFNCVNEHGFQTDTYKDYVWDDTPVTAEQYEQHLEEYIDSDTALTTGSKESTVYDYEGILNHLSSVTAEGNAQRNAYIANLKNHPEKVGSWETEYTLYDIDKDGIQELIVREGLEGMNGYYVYTSDGCHMLTWPEMYSLSLYAYDGNGLVISYNGFTWLSVDYLYLYTLEDGNLKNAETLASTKELYEGDYYIYLTQFTPIDQYYPITDHTPLQSLSVSK